jgi:hypothetical protein
MSMHRGRIDWEYHITRQKKSGLTIKAYSQREGFSSWSFYQHRKMQQQKTRVLESKGNHQPATHTSFIPVGTFQSRLPQISIHFRDNTRLELHAMPSTAHLECIVSTLLRYSGGRVQC